MDYKSTLNLPNTDFSMKANLPQKEPLFLKKWQEQDLYAKILQKRKGSPKYTLHDGPPYANGDIHIGHALNKILKDIIVKYKTMRGSLSRYVPGWDCHGLPVEHQLFKELKLTKGQIDQVVFRKKAHDYAMRYVGIQREQFKRLGVFGDWDNPYLTLSKDYEAEILRAFAKLVKGGYIYKGLKPVNWCYVCETALAEAEVEYEDHTSPSIYVKFRVASCQSSVTSKKLTGDWKLETGDCYFIIWTTTPWTLIANVAIAVHPDFEYAFVKIKNETWVIMKDLVGAVMEKAGEKIYEILKTARGRELEGSACKHPFIERGSKVVLANYVSNLDGTGCVHTAPGHGQEDYL
ncbi:MAG: class I tRNA ligase family protein, partial [Candidatus Omnitrophica bacterium]|nr:class I tRNA ligase family protein [Candidatus Omnitrophota bacterium]